MPAYVPDSKYFSVGGTDLSAYLTDLSITIDNAPATFATFGASGWQSNKPGLKSAMINATFIADFAASALYQALKEEVGTVAAFEARPDDAAAAATNPKFTGNCLIAGFDVLPAGGPGEPGTISVSWPVDGAVTAAEST